MGSQRIETICETLERRRMLAAGFAQAKKLLASDGAATDYFGFSVARSGSNVLIGSYKDDDSGTDSGSVYHFNAATGSQVAKLRPLDGEATDCFGAAVAISGNIALVGSYYDDDNGLDSGSAYLFDITSGTQLAKLKPVDGAPGDVFGLSVAISRNVAIVGSAYYDDRGVDSGSAYVFDVITGAQIAKLTATDGEAYDYFGASVSISGTAAIIGCDSDDDNGAESGSAYLFDITTGAQISKLTPADGAAYDHFGVSVAIEGDTALIGSFFDRDNGIGSGSAYLFNTATGLQIAKLTPNDGAAYDQFGEAVALSANAALVGSPLDDDNGTDSGSAYLFDTTEGVQIAKLKATDGTTLDHFGRALALSGNTAVVGSYLDSVNGSFSGSAYLFSDQTAPTVDSARFEFQQAQRLVFDFSEPVRSSLSPADLQVIPLAGGAPITPSSVSYNAVGDIATFVFDSPIPDGRYTAKIAAGSILDAGGNPLTSDSTLNFFVLAGDLNRDQTVNFDDLLILSQNYGQTGKTFGQGNIDYSADGLVGFDDLLLLAQRYGTTLAKAPASRARRTGPLAIIA